MELCRTVGLKQAPSHEMSLEFMLGRPNLNGVEHA
uniref:Uncharacterized protein n=1 Tax=Arundo donax TaxID=35708 RepID=A0A0A8YV96_ARUDO